MSSKPKHERSCNERNNQVVRRRHHLLIFDSSWLSPIHWVPKKGRIAVVTNENNELIPTCTVTGWRVCMAYCELNQAMRKDRFPQPFVD